MINRIMMLCIAATLCVLGTACKDKNDSNLNANRGSTSDKVQPVVAADNTARNEVDRNANTKTPFDQSESSQDIKITAEIRKEVMKVENMSTNGQNCKIMTANGVVTLRGPVNSSTEKDRIGVLAGKVAGVSQVDNQLEIKTP